MTSFPRAKTDDCVAIEAAGILVIQDSHGQELARLDRVTALVWRLADGTTPVDEIARMLISNFDVAADEEVVWSALDRLADLNLLTARLTPPVTGTLSSRRGMIRMAVLGGAAAASSLGYKPAYAAPLPLQQEQLQKTKPKQLSQPATTRRKRSLGRHERIPQQYEALRERVSDGETDVRRWTTVPVSSPSRFMHPAEDYNPKTKVRQVILSR